MWIRGVIVDHHLGQGSDDPIDLRVAGPRIHHSSGTGTPDFEGYIVPGLVDVHCHLGLAEQGAVDDAATLAQAHAVAKTGVLAVRDAGSPRDTKFLDKQAGVPHVIRAGRHLALPKRYLRGYGLELNDSSELADAAAAQARSSDGWVKLVGDWINRSGSGDLEPLWAQDDLTAGVQAAHAHGARVTVHTFASETIPQIFAAGVDCIEHGTGMSAADIEYAATAGIPVVPTLLQVEQFEAIADAAGQRYPTYAARMRRMHARRYDQLRDFAQAGVMLMVGSDAGGTIAHGSTIAEALAWVAAGIDGDEVVAALSWRTRIYLGLPLLTDGAPADFVVYPRDPRLEPQVLMTPSAIVRQGQLIAAG